MEAVSLPDALPLFEPSLCGAASGPPHGNFPSRPKHETAVDGSELRVLWIDDEVHLSDAEVRSLELEGFRVDCVETGQEGLSLARQRTFDAILLDLRLADESGLDVLEQLIDAGVTAPIVVLTGFAEVDTAVAAMKLGAADYRMKPFNVEVIAPLLRNLRSQRSQEAKSERPQLTELEWLQVQCDRMIGCITKLQMIALILRTIVDPRLTLRSFFGCAEALRLILTSAETSRMLLALSMRDSILRGAQTPLPQHPRLRKALAELERVGAKHGQQLFTGLSRSYFSRLVSMQTGRHVSEWCRAAVMRAALREVLGTSEMVSQIAYSAGYTHPGQFDREFLQMFGVTPTELRGIASLVSTPALRGRARH